MEQWIYQTEWLGNSTFAWICAGIGALVGYVVVHGAAAIVTARLRALAKRRPDSNALRIAAAVSAATRGWVVLLLAIVIALRSLGFDAKTNTHLDQLIIALVGVQVAFWLTRLIVASLQRATPDGGMQRSNPVIYGILTWSAQLVVWVVLLLVVLDNAGVNVNAFIASLGIGGVALALAAQNVLGDLFASIAIGLDKPFKVDEFIAFDKDLGTVKKVGIKTTRIDSLSGEEMSIANSQLLQKLVHNYTRMEKRRVVFGFSVPLGTSSADLRQIATQVRQFIEDQDQTSLDRGHFIEIGDHGFRFEFVYYVLDPGYTLYCDIQQAINLQIVDHLRSMEVEFAVPVRAVSVRDEGKDSNIAAAGAS